MAAELEWECIARREFNDDIVITDPCYLDCDMMQDDCGIGDNGIVSRTYYGDWMCTLFRTDRKTGRVRGDADGIGTFTADAGMVCVVGMKFARSVKPDVDQWIHDHGRCAVVIRGFDGSVRLMRKTATGRFKDGTVYHDYELRVRIDGKVNGKSASFESVQTGG